MDVDFGLKLYIINEAVVVMRTYIYIKVEYAINISNV